MLASGTGIESEQPISGEKILIRLCCGCAAVVLLDEMAR